ncbi:MAG: Crp/Fnr family transcriptional regulator [Balneolales bacterium]|nr:Crp/Fnr family transcriptional regulator [Balneolales bacterium]
MAVQEEKHNPATDDHFTADPDFLKKIQKAGEVRKFKTGEIIAEENTASCGIPIVTRGSVKVMQTDEENRELVLYYLRPGESCIMSFLGGLHNEASSIRIVAEDNTELLLVPVEKMMELIRAHPSWLNYIFRLYHKRFQELLEVVHAVSFKKMDERLADYLAKKASLTGSKIIYITHEQIGADLGTARVVVSRLLKEMEKQGLVELSRNKIILAHPFDNSKTTD